MQVRSTMTAADFKAHGSTHISNTGGIEIMMNRSNDGVYYRYVPGDPNEIYEAGLREEPNEDNPDQYDIGFYAGECFFELQNFTRV